MQTHEMIQALAEDLRPVSPKRSAREVLFALVFGATAALCISVFVLGSQTDFGRAAHGWSLWLKWIYTIPICGSAFLAMQALSRPAESFSIHGRMALMSIAAVAGMAASELSHAPMWLWPSLGLGESWQRCPWRILFLSVPVFGALVWKIRQAAPTRLRLTGAAIGLTSGACAATLYALGCAEQSAVFVMAWYSLGMILSGTVGALLGPILLRW